jgi:hypothetical protein
MMVVRWQLLAFCIPRTLELFFASVAAVLVHSLAGGPSIFPLWQHCYTLLGGWVPLLLEQGAL